LASDLSITACPFDLEAVTKGLFSFVLET